MLAKHLPAAGLATKPSLSLPSTSGRVLPSSSRPARCILSVRTQALSGTNGTAATTLNSGVPATVESAWLDTTSWQPVSLAKATLMELQGIPLQKTADQYNLTISYEPTMDELVVIDYAKGVRFPAVFGPDNKVRVDLSNAVPTAVIGLSFEALSSVLRADSAGAEIVNGRAAMLGVFLGLLGEVTNNDIVVRQLFTTEGAYNAMLVGALVLAASVAPAILGRVPSQHVFPDEQNPPAQAGDFPNVWNYNAERLNGRVAMVGFLGLMVSEMLSERQCGLVTKVLSNFGNWSC